MNSILCTSLSTAPHLTISCRPFGKTMSNIHGKEQSRLLHPVQSTQSKILDPGLQRRMLPSSLPTLLHIGQTIDSHVERQPTKLKIKAIRSRQGFVFQKEKKDKQRNEKVNKQTKRKEKKQKAEKETKQKDGKAEKQKAKKKRNKTEKQKSREARKAKSQKKSPNSTRRRKDMEHPKSQTDPPRKKQKMYAHGRKINTCPTQKTWVVSRTAKPWQIRFGLVAEQPRHVQGRKFWPWQVRRA